MPNKNQQQIEFEVFPKEDKFNYSYLSGMRNETPRDVAPINVIFSYQSVIIIFICAMMLLIASFALGVEKGKLIVKNNVNSDKAIVTASSGTPAVPSVASTIQEKSLPLNMAQTQTTVVSKENPVVTNSAVALTANVQNETAPLPIQGGYTIQVASVLSEKAAKTMSESLLKKGITSFTRTSGKYVIVLAGNFSKKEEAQSILRELKKTYADCFIKKI
jgi:cell division septation protein DedD